MLSAIVAVIIIIIIIIVVEHAVIFLENFVA